MNEPRAVCPRCGSRVGVGPAFCPFCGTRLTETARGASVLAILGAVLLILIAVGLGAMGACFSLFGGMGLRDGGIMLLGLGLALLAGAVGCCVLAAHLLRSR